MYLTCNFELTSQTMPKLLRALINPFVECNHFEGYIRESHLSEYKLSKFNAASFSVVSSILQNLKQQFIG